MKLSGKLSIAAQALLIAGTIAVAAPACAAPVQLITNGGFETGNFAGWTINSTGGFSNAFSVVHNGGSAATTGYPTQLNATGGTFVALSDQNGPGGEELRQSFTKTAGMTSLTLSFDWFDNNHHTGFSGTAINGSNQVGRVDILSAGAGAFDTGAGVVSNLLINAGSITPLGNTIPWLHASYDLSALANGTYDLRFGNGQCCYYQEFGVDNVSLVATVPEPGSIALGLIGLAGLGWHRRRKQQAAVA